MRPRSVPGSGPPDSPFTVPCSVAGCTEARAAGGTESNATSSNAVPCLNRIPIPFGQSLAQFRLDLEVRRVEREAGAAGARRRGGGAAVALLPSGSKSLPQGLVPVRKRAVPIPLRPRGAAASRGGGRRRRRPRRGGRALPRERAGQ